MAQPLIILGTGGNVHDLLDIVEASNRQAPTWNVIGFLDDTRAVGDEFLGLPVLGPLRKAATIDHSLFINAIGSDTSYRRREGILAALGIGPERFASLVHPAASVSARAVLGRGVYVSFGACVGGNAVLGDHVSVGPGCLIGHDTHIAPYSVVAPGAVVSGSVRIGRSCYLGAASSIRQCLRIGDGALVGMGAVVVRDVGDGEVVVGNPARPFAVGKATE